MIDIRLSFAALALASLLSTHARAEGDAGRGVATSPPYLDPERSFAARAADLVSRMTLEEKVAQMQNAAPAIPRLGVPEYDWWNEALHGVARAGEATVFPQAIGLAATFDTGLMSEVATAISDEARAKYNRFQQLGIRRRYTGLTFWSPNINIFRDPRWGRGQETYGEDPFLTSRMGVTFVRGLQGGDESATTHDGNAQTENAYRKLDATAKHFAVHSGPESERHRFDVHPSERDLFETYLPAFRALVQEGKVDAVMGAYNRVNGEAATASERLLQDILRRDWGFNGYIVSDCDAVEDIWKHHGIVRTAAQAAALAVRRGDNLNCGTTYGARWRRNTWSRRWPSSTRSTSSMRSSGSWMPANRLSPTMPGAFITCCSRRFAIRRLREARVFAVPMTLAFSTAPTRCAPHAPSSGTGVGGICWMFPH